MGECTENCRDESDRPVSRVEGSLELGVEVGVGEELYDLLTRLADSLDRLASATNRPAWHDDPPLVLRQIVEAVRRERAAATSPQVTTSGHTSKAVCKEDWRASPFRDPAHEEIRQRYQMAEKMVAELCRKYGLGPLSAGYAKACQLAVEEETRRAGA